jgi:hypothetical protein
MQVGSMPTPRGKRAPEYDPDSGHSEMDFKQLADAAETVAFPSGDALRQCTPRELIYGKPRQHLSLGRQVDEKLPVRRSELLLLWSACRSRSQHSVFDQGQQDLFRAKEPHIELRRDSNTSELPVFVQ